VPVILVADDDPDIVELLSSRLEANSYKVITAYDAVCAVEMAHNEKPDLIILDIKMPGGGGVGALENLKLSRVTRNIPVICISASTATGVCQEALDKGAKAFIAKPFDAEQLLKEVKKQLTDAHSY